MTISFSCMSSLKLHKRDHKVQHPFENISAVTSADLTCTGVKMPASTKGGHWLDYYGSPEYKWKSLDQCNRTIFYRPLGLVEFAFDADGRYFEGRADLNSELSLEVRSTLSDEDFRERILFALACLRCHHLLLQAKAISCKRMYGREFVAGSDVCFAIETPRTVIQAIEDCGAHLVFLKDHFDSVDPQDFWVHCQNTARVIDPDRALAKFFIYPLEKVSDGAYMLRILKVGAHQIEDGLTNYIWMRDLVHYLNKPIPQLRKELRELLEPQSLERRLPPPQEALYPPITGSKARQRWFWVLTRILRHVRKPHMAGFVNPLRRRTPRKAAVPLSPTYSPILDYEKTPLLNATPCFAKASAKATRRLHTLCRETRSSIGAGCFALAALIMMEFHERSEPDISLDKRRPFITGFPLNPRSFFNHHVEPDSLMLGFSDGISLPFLPSHLNLDGRLRLLIRQAHRQLMAYQKRDNPSQNKAGLQYMGSRGAGRILSTLYINCIERTDERVPGRPPSGLNPQGAYPGRPNMSAQTCGVSSVGRRENIVRQHTSDLEGDAKDFVADYRNVFATVRPRDDEFLIGIGGSDDGLWVNATVDGNSMDPVLVGQWKTRFENILEEEDGGVKASKL